MELYFLKKKIFTVIFLAVLLVYSGINFYQNANAWMESIRQVPLTETEGGSSQIKTENMTALVSGLEESMNEHMWGRMNWIEVYSYAQKVLNKREFNNFSFIKDEEGYLHYASFFREEDDNVFSYALRVKRMQDYVEGNGTKVLFVVPPSKYIQGYTKLQMGMPVNDPNAVVNELLFDMNRLGIETLDLRKYFPNEELSYEEVFFKSDHHWTIPAAFYATQILSDAVLEKFGEDLDPDDYYLNPEQYETVIYSESMLGSMGRRTGANFCGLEDFAALWPEFTVHYMREYDQTGDGIQIKTGTTEEALMHTSVLEDPSDAYSDSLYSLYINSVCPYEKIVNEDNKEGPKMLFIRDSYFSPVITFLAPVCSEIHAIWSVESGEKYDIESYIKENDFDYIIAEVYPYSIEEKAFNFFKEEN